MYHSGHNCQTPGNPRGSFALPGGKSDANDNKVDAVAIVTALTDKDGAYARKISKPLPPDRVVVYAAHKRINENQRMKFWASGTPVTEDPKELVTYITTTLASDGLKTQIGKRQITGISITYLCCS